MFAAASDELAGHHACFGSMFGDAQCWRDYLLLFRGLKISILAEFATNELEGMKGELVWRCRSLTHPQAMQVCVVPVRTRLHSASRRPFPLEDRAVSNLCTISGAAFLSFARPGYTSAFLIKLPKVTFNIQLRVPVETRYPLVITWPHPDNVAQHFTLQHWCVSSFVDSTCGRCLGST